MLPSDPLGTATCYELSSDPLGRVTFPYIEKVNTLPSDPHKSNMLQVLLWKNTRLRIPKWSTRNFYLGGHYCTSSLELSRYWGSLANCRLIQRVEAWLCKYIWMQLSIRKQGETKIDLRRTSESVHTPMGFKSSSVFSKHTHILTNIL